MLEPFCKECRFWGELAFKSNDEYRTCMNLKLRARPCCEVGEEFGEGANIATLADFGCTDFEKA